MEFLEKIVGTVNDYLSGYILVFLLVGVGLYYSIKTRFVQIRCLGEGFRRVFKKYDRLNESIEENVRAMRVVKGFSREEYEKEKQALTNLIVSLITPLVEYSQAMAKVLALSQENTPESRVAILEVIQSLGMIDKNLIDQAKKVVSEEVEAKEEKKQAIVEQLEQIENKPVE